MVSLPSYSEQFLNEYRGDILTSIAAVFIAFESISVLLRIYARKLSTSPVGWDDVVIPLGWLANIGTCVLGISQRATMILQ